MNIEKVIARLWASKQKFQDGFFERGVADGKRWAEESAETEELKRLEAVREENPTEFEWVDFWHVGDRDFSPGIQFFHCIMEQQGSDEGDIADFWSPVLGDNYEDSIQDERYVRGFAEGALEVWEDVKDDV